MEKRNKTVGLMGLGEIGLAIQKCYEAKGEKALVRDTGKGVDEFADRQLDVLHVAIPGSLPDFVEAVCAVIDECGRNAVVIIHSSTPVGTTERIAKFHKFTVHSYVRGVHPHLYEGLMAFVKYVGADFAGAGRLAADELEFLGMECEVRLGSRNTEAAKLWDTTAYGLSIVLEKEIHRYCAENGLNFGMVYADATESYNSGYSKLGMSNVLRPVLKHMDGPTGGHCVLPNCRLLGGDVADFILKKNGAY